MFHSLYKQTPTASPAPTADEPFSLYWPAAYRAGETQGFCPLDAEHWALEVDGLVDKPQRFSLKDLQGFMRIQQNRRLIFADGWSYRATWEGFVVQELLHRVAPRAEARFLHQVNAAGQVECMPLQDLYTQRALFCLRADGFPLPAMHGGPLRLLVFDRYAHKGLGQIVRLTLSDSETSGSYAALGYEPHAAIQPGDYYAADLRLMQPVREPGEVTQW